MAEQIINESTIPNSSEIPHDNIKSEKLDKRTEIHPQEEEKLTVIKKKLADWATLIGQWLIFTDTLSPNGKMA